MINLFRKLRRSLVRDNKTKDYFKYAFGEIALVMVGILLALQVNNWNEGRKLRNTELIYLEELKSDLELNLVSIDSFVNSRNTAINSSEIILNYFHNPQSLTLDEFNVHSINVMVWYPFEHNDNTFQELLNSGKLSIITNKAIKTGLQNWQTRFKKIAFIESEMEQDYERYFYEPYFSIADLEVAFKNYNAQMSKQKIEHSLKPKQVQILLKNQKFKNGFTLANYNSELLIIEYSEMIKTINEVLGLIDHELAREFTL
jgi:uncharacterized protein DUF6090